MAMMKDVYPEQQPGPFNIAQSEANNVQNVQYNPLQYAHRNQYSAVPPNNMQPMRNLPQPSGRARKKKSCTNCKQSRDLIDQQQRLINDYRYGGSSDSHSQNTLFDKTTIILLIVIAILVIIILLLMGSLNNALKSSVPVPYMYAPRNPYG